MGCVDPYRSHRIPLLSNHKLMSINTQVDLGSVVALLALAISVSVTFYYR